MKEIAIHEIKDGMVLASEVVDESGNVLMVADGALSKAHIEILERRGILTVKVVEPDDGAGGDDVAPSQRELEKAIGELEHMFEGKLEDPIMKAIHSAARGMLECALPGRRK